MSIKYQKLSLYSLIQINKTLDKWQQRTNDTYLNILKRKIQILVIPGI